MRKEEYVAGIKDGIPICLGYFSVSLAFGLTAVLSGMPAWAAVVISDKSDQCRSVCRHKFNVGIWQYDRDGSYHADH